MPAREARTDCFHTERRGLTVCTILFHVFGHDCTIYCTTSNIVSQSLHGLQAMQIPCRRYQRSPVLSVLRNLLPVFDSSSRHSNRRSSLTASVHRLLGLRQVFCPPVRYLGPSAASYSPLFWPLVLPIADCETSPHQTAREHQSSRVFQCCASVSTPHPHRLLRISVSGCHSQTRPVCLPSLPSSSMPHIHR